MTSIAADEDLVVAHLVDDQAAPNPVLPAEQFVFEILVNAEHGADRGVTVDRLKVRDPWLEIDMDQPVLLAVDGVDVAGLPRIQCEGSPCRSAALFQQHAEQLRRANVT